MHVLHQQHHGHAFFTYRDTLYNSERHDLEEKNCVKSFLLFSLRTKYFRSFVKLRLNN